MSDEARLVYRVLEQLAAHLGAVRSNQATRRVAHEEMAKTLGVTESDILDWFIDPRRVTLDQRLGLALWMENVGGEDAREVGRQLREATLRQKGVQEPPEYQHIRSILALFERALSQRTTARTVAHAEIAAALATSADEVARWHDEPWRVPLYARFVLALLANRTAAVVAQEADEAVGIQLRVITARQLAAHVVSIQQRHANSDWTPDGVEFREFVAAFGMIPMPETPVVDDDERAKVATIILAQDDDDLDTMLRRLGGP